MGVYGWSPIGKDTKRGRGGFMGFRKQMDREQKMEEPRLGVRKMFNNKRIKNKKIKPTIEKQNRESDVIAFE